MSAPAWLLDAIQATKPESVPTVPNPQDIRWEQDSSLKSLILKGFESHVPNVPTVLTVLSPIQPPGDQSEIENTQRELRRSKVLNLLEGKRFALLIEDGSTDPVIATIGIQNLAIFELAIPQHSYDGIALLELIEKHYGQNHASR